MVQTKEDLEGWYSTKVDPWDYQTTPCDHKRKRFILAMARAFAPYDGTYIDALDLGAGEGWITKDLPAMKIYGYERSDSAASRFPPNVTRVGVPIDKYDLVTATGVLYIQYDWQTFVNLILEHSSRTIITCNIKQWELSDAIDQIKERYTEVLSLDFPYRQFTQKLRLFRV